MICCLNPDCQKPQNPDSKQFCQSCNTPLLPLLRNRFRVIRVLSDEGGFGRTYLSEDTDKLNDCCVVKQLAPKFQGTWSQKKAMELFSEEAKRLRELGEHPQIPTLLAYFEQDNCLYLVQQFIDGNNLLKELQLRKTYRDWDIQSILLDLLPILKFIHSRGVIHRDIKPENIIRRKSDGRLTLIDFGSSKQLTARVQKKNGTSIGSHGYSSIEQIRDGKAYAASDLFSLGATCFHLITGISPFQLWMEHGYSWVKNWQDYLRCPLSHELAQIIDKLLQIDIQNRYQSADDVIKDLSKQYTHLLAPASNSFLAVPTKKTRVYPRKYIFLRNSLLVVATILFLGLGEFGYRHFHQIQTAILAKFISSANSNATNDAILYQSPQESSEKFSLVKTISEPNNLILSVAISPDSQTIASGGNGIIKLWNVATGKEVTSLSGHIRNVNVVTISPDGKNLVSGSDDQTIKIWNLITKKLSYTLKSHTDSVQALAISKDGKTLVSASDDKTIKVWNLDTGKLIRTLKGHSYWVRSVAISPNGVTLASGSFDKTIKLWNITQEKSIHQLTPNSQTVTSLAFSPDSKILASASRDRKIKLWDIGTGKVIHTLTGSDHNVTTVAFSPDGKILASGNRDCLECDTLNQPTHHNIKLWDVATGKELTALTGHINTVTSLVFSADGKTLVSGGEDNKIKIWRFSQ
ncbi:serine/threonine protein kinase [Anabaena cylindrica FACHB-243]|uniref:Serine/threonine protein kinase with WD40 repeats n=1 Tax=Anabaena cylindrica (strain ATCC 27899 / PCC 7122) TaxID=272123 RepID=K9ZLK2_ANACC|nr:MULTISPECIES: serine/threonine-protein kinase [Anabaena]AFZ60133.1 serine/threonine protein kinase with WD40 repeats [Anabaena cylindrica PCC 7122]MBD2417812.1 serine/threonine protein kinase [Anabaena cylindrica FACHB-243]MBY5285286.1 protein kinase [Anabaena sp. CCAP 1446/1C]MBY5307995.1 protein kinase [Anabaena sp. CCAP 1446/1C]MCM2404727.1 serine/threonine protein kinase [Anabaena sp. CCAP 1446/1C]